jgi:hypothetical protein
MKMDANHLYNFLVLDTKLKLYINCCRFYIFANGSKAFIPNTKLKMYLDLFACPVPMTLDTKTFTHFLNLGYQAKL